MNRWKRCVCLALSVILVAAMALPAAAADPLANSFASFLISADSSDFPVRSLHVELYRRDASGQFQLDDDVQYDCSINRAAGDVTFLMESQADGVWVEVDYLTDLDGDGVYEMLDGENTPVCDTMNTAGKLAPWNGSRFSLDKGKTYTLSAEALQARGQEILQARNTAGSGQTLPNAGQTLTGEEDILYYVSLHYLSAADGREYTLGYYLQIFDSILIPHDVPANAWYYDAVVYALEEGLLSGTGDGTFTPTGAVTRGQLAQILWRLGGSKMVSTVEFSDVAETDWYFKAVNWCSRKGIMTGTGDSFQPNAALTREQLALVLWQFAHYEDLEMDEDVQDLSRFTDGAAASNWAKTGLEWATSCGLLSGYTDGTLKPRNGISRAELVVVLRSFCVNLLDRR